MNKINPSIELFPIINNKKEKIIQLIKIIKMIGIENISITFNNNRNIYYTINYSIQIKKYYFNTIIHIPFWSIKISKITKIIRINNINNFLILKGDIYKKSLFNIPKTIKKQVKNNNLNLYGTCYPNNHLMTKKTIIEHINLYNKIINGIKYFVSQINIEKDPINYFIKTIKKYYIIKNIIIGIPIIYKYNNIETLITNNNYILTKEINQNIFNKLNKKIIYFFNIYIKNIIKLIIKKNILSIHFYSMNNPSLIKNLINFLINK